MLKTIIATNSPARNILGGPGRFAPMLYAALYERCNVDLMATFGGKVYSTPDDVCYFPLQSAANTSLKVAIAESLPSLTMIVIKNMRRNRSKASLEKISEANVKIIHAHDFDFVEEHKNFEGKIILTNHYKGSLYNESLGQKRPWTSEKWAEYYTEKEIKAIQRADVITFPSNSAKILLQEDYPKLSFEIEKKSVVIYTGINSEMDEVIKNQSYQGGTKNIVLNIGNHIKDKGVDLAVKFFHRYFSKMDDYIFINVGQAGPETERISKYISEHNLNDRVKLLGLTPYESVLNYIKQSKLILHTPRRVVFDLSLLECMRYGKSIVASNVLGNKEALGDDYPLYITTTDSEDLEFELKSLIDMDYLNDLGVGLKKRFLERFTDKNMVENYTSLYKTL